MIDIIVNLDVIPGKRKMSLTELADKVGIIMSNVYVLKKSKTKAIMPSSLSPLVKF